LSGSSYSVRCWSNWILGVNYLGKLSNGILKVKIVRNPFKKSYWQRLNGCISIAQTHILYLMKKKKSISLIIRQQPGFKNEGHAVLPEQKSAYVKDCNPFVHDKGYPKGPLVVMKTSVFDVLKERWF